MIETSSFTPPLEFLILPLFIIIFLHTVLQIIVTMKLVKSQFEISAAIRIIHIELQKLDPDFPKWMQKEAEEAEKDLEKI